MLLFTLVAAAYAIDGAFDCAAWTTPADAWPAAAALDLDDSRYGARASGVYSVPFADVIDVITAYSEPGCPYYDDAGDLVDETGTHDIDQSCTTAAGDSIEWYRVPQDGYDTGETYGEWEVTIRPASGALTELHLSSLTTGANQHNHDAADSFRVDDWTWSAEWTGHLGDDYPDDGWMQLSAQPASWSDYLTGDAWHTLALTWASSTCDWAVDFSQVYDGVRTTSWTLTQGSQILTVDGDEADTCSVEGAEATLDGATSTVTAEGWTPLTDRDGDGYCVEVDDCRDIQARVHPGARDIPYDGIDQDCDGLDIVDIDHDGHSALAAGGDDCDDFRATVHPGAWDRPHDGFDQDCDGVP